MDSLCGLKQAPEFWGNHGSVPMAMGAGSEGMNSAQQMGSSAQHHAMLHRGARGNARQHVSQGRMGQAVRGSVLLNGMGSNKLGLKHRATMGNGKNSAANGCHSNVRGKTDLHASAAKAKFHDAAQSESPQSHRKIHDRSSRKAEPGQTSDNPPPERRAQSAEAEGAGRESIESFESQVFAFAIQVARVEAGEDVRTTLMVKNIPNKYTQRNLLDLIDASFAGVYDFFYLPIDFKNKCNLGYAFINFREPCTIAHFFHEFDQKRWGRFNSDKICMVTYARIQVDTASHPGAPYRPRKALHPSLGHVSVSSTLLVQFPSCLAARPHHEHNPAFVLLLHGLCYPARIARGPS